MGNYNKILKLKAQNYMILLIAEKCFKKKQKLTNSIKIEGSFSKVEAYIEGMFGYIWVF